MGDFSKIKLDIGKNAKIANEHQVHIKLESDYKWGRGWTQSEAERFEDVVYNNLSKGTNYYVEPAKDSYSCPHLKSGERGNKLDLYLHPMEFTGYASPKDLNKIMEILEKECKSVVYEVSVIKDKEVYDMSDYEYRKLILDKSKEIAEVAAKIKAEYGYLGDIGFDFARECRIDRYGDAGVLCGRDVDVSTVWEIAEIAEKLGYFEKQKQNVSELTQKAYEDGKKDGYVKAKAEIAMKEAKVSSDKDDTTKRREEYAKSFIDNMLWTENRDLCGYNKSYITVELYKQKFTDEDKKKFEKLIMDDIVNPVKSIASLSDSFYAHVSSIDNHDVLIFDISKGYFESAERLSKEFPDAVVFVKTDWDEHYFDVYKNGSEYSSYLVEWDGDEPEPYVEDGEEYYDCDIKITIDLPWGESDVTYAGGGGCSKVEYLNFQVQIKASEENYKHPEREDDIER